MTFLIFVVRCDAKLSDFEGKMSKDKLYFDVTI